MSGFTVTPHRASTITSKPFGPYGRPKYPNLGRAVDCIRSVAVHRSILASVPDDKGRKMASSPKGPGTSAKDTPPPSRSRLKAFVAMSLSRHCTLESVDQKLVGSIRQTALLTWA